MPFLMNLMMISNEYHLLLSGERLVNYKKYIRSHFTSEFTSTKRSLFMSDFIHYHEKVNENLKN